MTTRMITAIANPHMDILGHCTGRLIKGRGRAESTFDAELVFAACRELDKAVEVNCRPERLDPPRRMLAMVDDMGVKVAIDTDAHARGQLAWHGYGCARVAETGIGPDRIVNAWAARRSPRLDRRPRSRRLTDPVPLLRHDVALSQLLRRRTAPSLAARVRLPATGSPSRARWVPMATRRRDLRNRDRVRVTEVEHHEVRRTPRR